MRVDSNYVIPDSGHNVFHIYWWISFLGQNQLLPLIKGTLKHTILENKYSLPVCPVVFIITEELIEINVDISGDAL